LFLVAVTTTGSENKFSSSLCPRLGVCSSTCAESKQAFNFSAKIRTGFGEHIEVIARNLLDL